MILFFSRVYAVQPDARIQVHFPAALIDQTLDKMRDHLSRISQIQEALGVGDYLRASSIAETYLGLSSVGMHWPDGSDKFSPKEMQELGVLLHQNASEFANEAKSASITGNVKPALIGLAKTTQVCVACHAAYKLR